MKTLILLITTLAALAGDLSLSPRKWSVIREGSAPFELTNTTGSLDFVFPGDGNSINYLTQVSPGTWTTTATVRAEIQVVAPAGVTFFAEGAQYVAPAVRLFFAKKNYLKSSQHARWWSNPIDPATVGSYPLADGSVVLSVTLDPANWTCVDGTRGSDNVVEFTKAIQSINEIGVTFGGEFFGHGVWTTGGTATFKLLRYSVQ